jgi:hypothetical protein
MRPAPKASRAAQSLVVETAKAGASRPFQLFDQRRINICQLAGCPS